jgi:hypothetical protein
MMQHNNKRKSSCGMGVAFHKYSNKNTCGGSSEGGEVRELR